MMKYLNDNWKAIAGLVAGIFVAVLVSSYLVVQKNSSQVFSLNEPEVSEFSSTSDVAIVFGGGIDNNGPRPILQKRLDTGAELLNNGKVQKLLLSGDNRYIDYNEPQAMYEYLVEERGIDSDKLQVDYAGRSTYETCERAKKIFGVNRALLVSERHHLSRAVYLCEHFGVDSIGVASDDSSFRWFNVNQYVREIFASTKAVFNVYIIGEETVLGEPIILQ